MSDASPLQKQRIKRKQKDCEKGQREKKKWIKQTDIKHKIILKKKLKKRKIPGVSHFRD